MAAGWLHFDFWTVLSICMACFRSALSLALVAHLIYCSIMRSATPHSGRALLSPSLCTVSLSLSCVPLQLCCWGVCRLSRIGNQINKAHANSRKWLHESRSGINSRWASGLAWAPGSLARKCLYIKYARANKMLSASIDKLKVCVRVCLSVCVRQLTIKDALTGKQRETPSTIITNATSMRNVFAIWPRKNLLPKIFCSFALILWQQLNGTFLKYVQSCQAISNIAFSHFAFCILHSALYCYSLLDIT